jgi:TPR repeat protein
MILRQLFWLKKAAEQGYQFAQRDLGKMYHGHGDNVEAVYWFRNAAEQGSEEAHSWLVAMGEAQ